MEREHLTETVREYFCNAFTEVPYNVDKKITDVLGVVNLSAPLDKLVGDFSGGQQARLLLALALIVEPDILLLDEPLGPIDHNARAELQGELRRIHRAFSLTTVHVTHARDEALALSTHCAVMLDGRIVQSGSTTDVFGNPRCLFVAHFLGADDPYDRLRKALKADTSDEAWAKVNSTISRPFPRLLTGKIAVKVINHYGDEVMKVFAV